MVTGAHAHPLLQRAQRFGLRVRVRVGDGGREVAAPAGRERDPERVRLAAGECVRVGVADPDTGGGEYRHASPEMTGAPR